MSFSLHVNEGRQGTHRYFTAAMRWGELDQMKIFPEDIKGEFDEEEQMQRGLARKRLGALADYLKESNHFFSALTLIILPRDLNRAAEEASEGAEEWDFMFERSPKEGSVRQTRGILHLSEMVRLFPADGQHRLRAAFMAMKEEPDLAREEVPVVLVPYKDVDQVRQLFSDLNLNAKPVNKTIGYAYDTRDPLTQIAKAVSRTVPLFVGRINRINNSLPATSSNVITLNTMVEGTRRMVAGIVERDKTTEDAYLAAKNLAKAQKDIVEAWTVIVDAFATYWDKVIDDTMTPGELRDRYVFPHGLGWLSLASVAGRLIVLDKDWAKAFTAAVESIRWERENPEWDGKAVQKDSVRNLDGSVETRYRVNNTSSATKSVTDFILERARGTPSLFEPRIAAK